MASATVHGEPPAENGEEAAPWRQRREGMVQVIAEEARALAEPLPGGGLDSAVLDAMGRVRRHELVPRALRSAAYLDEALPLGHGQTVSQPFIVALMTHLLRVRDTDAILEIGTGSGYQAAVLAELARRVYTVERVPELASRAREGLRRLGYRNVRVRTGDGRLGWPEHAPYDGVIVTAAGGAVPPPLISQLRPGGRLVIPLGEPGHVQWLTVLARSHERQVEARRILAVRFVPLEHGVA